MPATPARIGFITQEYRYATAGPDAAVVAKYGKDARNNDDAYETNFVSMADVATLCDERFALQNKDRRRFVQVARGVAFGQALLDSPATYATTPTVTVIDDEARANLPAIVTEISVDYESEQTSVASWG